MMLDIYSGGVDWNEIYRSFHSPADIAARINGFFEDRQAPMLYAGFPETAALLIRSGRCVRLVEFSMPIAEMAQSSFPELGEIQTGNILDVVGEDRATDVAIVCRISAYWHSQEDFALLVQSLSCFPRRRVLIDFYDRECVTAGERVDFSGVNGQGHWTYRNFENVVDCELPISIAEMEVEYLVDDIKLKYIAKRAFFTRASVKNYVLARMPGADIRISGPLITGDPSFSLAIDFPHQP